MMKRLDNIETPALLLDAVTLERNLTRMAKHLRTLGVALRPHVKTTKSIDVVRLALAGQPGGITVSTLKEAEYFLDHGIHDILYGVGIAPQKLGHAADLVRRGADLTLVLDNLAAADAVAAAARRAGVKFPVFIELDVDGHRSGVQPDSKLLIEVARRLADSTAVELQGVMAHAGESYNCCSAGELVAFAERERAGAVLGAERLREAGFAVTCVSVGSTPTAAFAANLDGVTEVRAGVYMLFDLVMAGIGVCQFEDIAASVLVTVIGHRSERGQVITDGGWMALSRDRGTAGQPVDQGYGVVRDRTGGPLADDLIVISANQEHGVIGRRGGDPFDVGRYPVGSLLRVLPNHACATSAQHERYQVVRDGGEEIVATWPRINGW